MISIISYILLVFADILLAASFGFQKKFQKDYGSTSHSSLFYNAIIGLFSAIIFLLINGFRINISVYSFIMGMAFSLVIMLYIIAGFKIMERGNMSLYTLFLMSGGMTIPYIWGILFLDEDLSIFRSIGLVLILIAIILSNSGAKKLDKKQLMLCIAVFFLNGASSVISKTHQISPMTQNVSSSDFVFITSIVKFIICVGILVFKKFSDKSLNINIPIKKAAPLIFIAAIADSTSFMLQLIGAKNLPATVLYPFITGGSIILTALCGLFVFKEQLTKRQWAGISICFVGTLLFL